MDSYTVVIEPDEDAYHAFVPTLPGCHTFGETVDEALLFIKEAIALYIEGHGSKTGKFNGVMAGFYNLQTFQGKELYTNYWTSTELGDNAWKRYIHKNYNKVYRYHGNKKHFLSIRCVKNNPTKK